MTSTPKTTRTLDADSPLAHSTPDRPSTPTAPKKQGLVKKCNLLNVRRLVLTDEEKREQILRENVRDKYLKFDLSDVLYCSDINFLHFIVKNYEPKSNPISDIELTVIESMYAAAVKRLKELHCPCNDCDEHIVEETSF